MNAADSNPSDLSSLTSLADALRSEDCPAPESFLAAQWQMLDPATRTVIDRHVETCAACQAERALAAEFDQVPEDDAEVAALVARMPVDPARNVVEMPPWRGLMAAAVAVCAAGLGALLWAGDRALPGVQPATSEQSVTRGAAIRLLAPVGEQNSRPQTFRWTATPGAVRYEVTVMDVTQQIVWQAQTATTELASPDEVRFRGTRWRWDVQAFDAQNQRVAQSAQGVYSWQGATNDD